jgi:beta-lactamase superfamily II metal-dependent hydrolase
VKRQKQPPTAPDAKRTKGNDGGDGAPAKPFTVDIEAIQADFNDTDREELERLETTLEGWQAGVPLDSVKLTILNAISGWPSALADLLVTYLFDQHVTLADVCEQYQFGWHLVKSEHIQARKDKVSAAAAAAHAQLLALHGAKTTVAFMNVGQGDCTLVRTSDGRLILIDCGHQTKQQDYDRADITKLQAVLCSKYFADTASRVIDIVVLSHPDEDHYNLLSEVLADFKISTVYHSATLDDYSSADTKDWLVKKSTNQIKITRNAGGLKKNDVDIITTNTPEKIEKQAILIHEEPTCKVYVLASDVPPQISGEDYKNTGSVVVLLDFISSPTVSHTVLVCGDATKTAEDFLVDRYQGNPNELSIKDIHLLRITHHGSDRLCSTPNFVATINPKHAVVSAGRRGVESHGLPKLRTLASFWRLPRLMKYTDAVKEHTTFYWYEQDYRNNGTDNNDTSSLNDVRLDGTTRFRSLYSTGSFGTIIWSPEHPDELTPFNTGATS